MTYAVGSIIQAADYNGFVGDTAVSSPYASAAAAQNKIAALIGVGFGNRGYGQTGTSLSTVLAGAIVYATSWNDLRSAMGTINTHTGSALTLQPSVAVGDVIDAQDGSSSRANISTLITTLDTNRNDAALAQMAVTSALTSTRVTAWGPVVTHEFTVNFGTEDAARYYFNSGGQIRLSASRAGGSSTSVNTAWTNLLNAMGTIKFAYDNTTYTGSGGSITNNIGYFNATASYQEIFIHYGAGGGYYSGIYYSIQARRESYVGANGGNGSLLRFLVTFNDTSAYGYYGGSVDGTLTSQIDQYKAGGVLTIASPTFTTVSGL